MLSEGWMKDEGMAYPASCLFSTELPQGFQFSRLSSGNMCFVTDRAVEERRGEDESERH
jgi:hypothetical protein